MLLMGDENGRTQHGNNNAYCQDNELAWMDWSPEPREEAFRAFVAGALALRRELPLLAAPQWIRGEPVSEGGLPGVRWLRPDATPMSRRNGPTASSRRSRSCSPTPTATARWCSSNASFVDVDFILPETGSATAPGACVSTAAAAPSTPARTRIARHDGRGAGRSMRLYSL